MSHDTGQEMLRDGDRITRDEFHLAYEQTPDDFRAELIGGIVRVPRASTRRHGNLTGKLGMLHGVVTAKGKPNGGRPDEGHR